jgi:hypothetical protein
LFVPNKYLFGDYDRYFKPLIDRIERERDQIQWEQKFSIAYFRGALTGRYLRKDGFLFGRAKLVIDSFKFPEMIDATFISVGQIDDQWLKDMFPFEVDTFSYIDIMSRIQHYKYIIAIDGNVSDWFRPMLSLFSDAVPIVIQSEYAPIYLESWVPWVHYVPVTTDQSDLLNNIEWL